MNTNEVTAKIKYARGSGRKTRNVTDAVKGMNAVLAIESLRFMRKGAAVKVRKVIQSAVANAVHNKGMNPETLVITKILVDDAPMFRRGMMESKGRYRQILKRNTHITVFVGEPTMQTKALKGKKKASKAEAVSEVAVTEPVTETTEAVTEAEVVETKPAAKKVAKKKPTTKK